ncbi:RNA polymerase sigma factor [Dasania marina]|uniref:RNA polymerase sigma factor n=1 Tax=Dasania marina TaxID=471499 RepID=UPI000379A71F|nr:sigma-70 family RNA polymerase sigma factor [Dasania marina]
MNTKKLFFIQTLFTEQQSGLRRFIASKAVVAHEAEDIAQDAFHNMLKMERPEQLENPKAYLYQIAANLALNRIRKQGRQMRYEDSLKADLDTIITANDPDQIVNGHEQLSQLMMALQVLPDKVKTAFLLSRAEDKSYSEIADEMGVSVSSVEKYLMTALKHLRKSA